VRRWMAPIHFDESARGPVAALVLAGALLLGLVVAWVALPNATWFPIAYHTGSDAPSASGSGSVAFVVLRPAATPQPGTDPFSQPTAVASNQPAPASSSSDIGASGLMIATAVGCVAGVLGAIVGLISLIVLLRGGYGPVMRALLRRPSKGRDGRRGAAGYDNYGRGYGRPAPRDARMDGRGGPPSRSPARAQTARRR
jgi:hypothetical protein